MSHEVNFPKIYDQVTQYTRKLLQKFRKNTTFEAHLIKIKQTLLKERHEAEGMLGLQEIKKNSGKFIKINIKDPFILAVLQNDQ